MLADELARWQDAGAVATLWWRDDDGGRPGPAFERLLALAAHTRVPLALAVVPAWLGPEVACALRESPPTVSVLQHGFAHVNHEPDPPPGPGRLRKAECGAARPAPVVLAELAEGWTRLTRLLGPRAGPVLVPPWNRVAPVVREALPAAGYRALSTFGPRAAREPAPGLRQVNCHVDPIVWPEAKRFAGATRVLEAIQSHLAARREGRVDADEPTGLLTHHRDTGPEGWAFLDELWKRLGEHPAVGFPTGPARLGQA